MSKASASANATELSTLKALTFRLSSTSTVQLPQQIPAIAASLVNCRTLLSSSATSGSKNASESHVAVHKFRTLLRTLLEDRTCQGRWSAIVLIKAAVETGGWETLQQCLPWVRGLLGILKKPDPPSSKKLCLITLTRIFTLTREYPTLVREITTPSLPTYIQVCLQIIAARPPHSLMQVILESFEQLLPRHPTIFRSYVKQIQPLLDLTVAPTPSSTIAAEKIRAGHSRPAAGVCEAARRLAVQAPSCASKGGGSEEWDKAIKEVTNRIHRVADKTFRAVVEDWQSTQGHSIASNGQTLENEVQDLDQQDIGLPPWSGIYAGGERLVGLLKLLKEYASSPTSSAVVLRVGLIMDVITRMFSITVPPSHSTETLVTVRFNNQVSREEREHLWTILPEVHIATIELAIALTGRFGDKSSVLDTILLDQLIWVFGPERGSIQLRLAVYVALIHILERSGPSLTKTTIESMTTIIRACCNDAISRNAASANAPLSQGQLKSNGVSQKQPSINADTFLASSQASPNLPQRQDALRDAAQALLPVLLAKLRPLYLSDSIRARLDRAAILIKHKGAMIASVLNPPPSKKFGKPAASILPLLVRLYPNDYETEALLRPRMPVIRIGRDPEKDDQVSEGEEMNETDLQNEIAEEMEEEDHFVGQELDTLLENEAHGAQDGASIDATEPKTTEVHLQPSPLATRTLAGAQVETSAKPEVGIGMHKRPQAMDAPLSPSKRAKLDEKETTSATPTPALAAIETSKASETPAVVTVDSHIIEELAGPTSIGNDSEGEDDFGELVLGHDTDDESEP